MKTTYVRNVPQIPVDYAGTVQSARKGKPPAVQMCVPIQSSADIQKARKKGREMAGELGFSPTDRTLIATAISELARTIVLHAGHGELCLNTVSRLGNTGIAITVSDKGPGIRDIRSAMQERLSSTSRGLGLGLPGVKRIMDEFEMVSKPRTGTTLIARKWKTQ